jgi:KipI family sensor histidine kinase inhibitor
MRLLPAGPAAWLIEAGDQAMALYAHLTANRPPEVVDVVPGERTVLVDGASRSVVEALVETWDFSGSVVADGSVVEIPVTYDGDDLTDVASLAGWTVAEVVAAHTQAELRVAFCGFAPGFAYLTGLPPQLHVPRLSTPRTAVPPGSVAIAAGFTAVYPRRSPGGWRIIGHTTVSLWNENASPPALLMPGATVRFTVA